MSKFLTFKINEGKIDNALKSTSFNKLSSMEEKSGFVESVISKKTKKKIKFFNLGRKNNWKKSLNSKITKKVESTFHNEMKELNYL